ncbi:MAG: hypothetical protein JST06_01110 [Bacteroidetes bacterium]|nr:hypothetical protein [Bacteroidota bacterium]
MPPGKGEMGVTMLCRRIANALTPKKGKTPPTPPPKKPKNYTLKVQVQCGGKNIAGAQVKVAGATVGSNGSGISDFGKKPEGGYDITVSFASDSDYVDLTTPVHINLSADHLEQVVVQTKNVVTTKIETEYNAIVLDRKQSDYQESTESKIVTDDVVAVQISFSHTNKSYPYSKTAKVEAVGAGAVDMFSDEACKKAFDGTIKKPDINSDTPFKLYLKAKTVGKFKLTVTPEDPADPKVKLKKAKEEQEMGVCEIKLRIYKQDIDTIKSKKIDQDVDPISTYHDALKNYELPKQKQMNNSDKIKKGRLLHEQKDNSHARARVILKIDASQWPDDCKDYELFVTPTNTSGSLELFDKDWEGTKWDTTKGVKISELKSKKGEKEFWAEGSAATNKINDIVLAVKMSRADSAGLAHKEKKNADWARFTVVKIEEVKLKYTAPSGGANAWDDAEKKFYINFKADPDGREITIHAKLSQKITGVPVYFMLASDKDNRKAATWGVDMPDTWKWKDMKAAIKHKDKTNRDDFLHLMKETNADGEAEVKLLLPRISGEKFVPSCYIGEDPQLAKYIDGHADLSKKKPVQSTTPIRVWRRFWIQPIRPHIMSAISLADSVGKYRATNAEMKVEADLVLNASDINVTPKAVYPEYMVKDGGGMTNRFVATDYNMNQFYSKVSASADKPLKVPMLLCEANFGDAAVSNSVSNLEVLIGAFPQEVQMSLCAMTPCIDDNSKNLLVSGTWKLYRPSTSRSSGWREIESGTLLPADVTILQTRTNMKCIHINRPSNIVSTDTNTKVVFRSIKINGASSFLGGYFGGSKTLLSVHNPSEPNDFHNTIVHELGHAFGQVIRPADSANLGVPDHPIQEDRGSGNHCNHRTGSHFDCVMYYSGMAGDPVLPWCDTCRPYVLLADMSKLD